MIPCAYLRVFQPLDAFPREEQLHWERYLMERARNELLAPSYRDQPTTGGLGLLVPENAEHADVRILEGVTYLSPWKMRMRVLAAELAFRESEPFEGWELFVTKREAKRVARELRRIRRREPRAVPFCHQSPWNVPVRWFALFRDDERRLTVDDEGEPHLRYRTTTRRAMRRAENAIPILRRSDLGPIAELILDLHQWMANFDPRSILELDYGGLCGLLTWEELEEDHSAGDVQASLDALQRFELPASADIYQRVLTRWAEVHGHESMN